MFCNFISIDLATDADISDDNVWSAFSTSFLFVHSGTCEDFSFLPFFFSPCLHMIFVFDHSVRKDGFWNWSSNVRIHYQIFILAPVVMTWREMVQISFLFWPSNEELILHCIINEAESSTKMGLQVCTYYYHLFRRVIVDKSKIWVIRNSHQFILLLSSFGACLGLRFGQPGAQHSLREFNPDTIVLKPVRIFSSIDYVRSKMLSIIWILPSEISPRLGFALVLVSR